MLGGQAGGDGAQPSYVERGKDSWRGYFGWMPAGTHAVEYVVRLNGSGRFTLPPPRVEAMYSPAIRGQWPNAPVTVANVGSWWRATLPSSVRVARSRATPKACPHHGPLAL